MNDHYDAIVVGSGASGGWAAKTLSEAGLSVLVLEAGPAVSPKAEHRGGPFAMVRRLSRVATGRQSRQSFHPAYWMKNPDFFVDDRQEPYTTAPGRPFNWIRGSQLGGRSFLWGGVLLRLSDYELEAGTRDGFGADWPLRYPDLAPWYDRVEDTLGVHGTSANLRQLPDGHYVGAYPLTAAEEKLREGVERTWPSRRVLPCRGIDGTAGPLPGTPWSRLTSLGTTFVAAHATGLTEVRTGAIVSHVIVDPSGKRARGVCYVDRTTGLRQEVHSRLVVLCASTISSTRILLHTAALSPRSGLSSLPALGRYLMDHVCFGTIVSIDDVPYQSPQPLSGAHGFLVPRFMNLDGGRENVRGGFGIWGGIQRGAVSGKKGSREARGFLVGQGDMIPRFENAVTLGSRRDRWGIPVPHIDCGHSEDDMRLLRVMRESIAELLSAGGGKILNLYGKLNFPGPWSVVARLESDWKSPPPGSYSHEVGGARMGDDQSSSVVDARNRCWTLPNLLVTDGACWPTAGWQNPALTIMAITARACEMAVASLKAGEL